ncbi:MAG: GTPase Era [bacterium]
MLNQGNAQNSFKSGFVSLIGPPNTGKSTLLNRIIGQKISIISPKPQTTRNRILGVWHGDSAQVIFFDTPGIHKSNKRLNKKMVQTTLKTFPDSDLIIMMIDILKPSLEDTDGRLMMSYIRTVKTPVFLVINKIDLVPKVKILELIDTSKDLFPFKEIIPLSALTGENCQDLMQTIISYLPSGPPYYPEEIVTDQTERFIASELIREKMILLTRQEIPYVGAVIIDKMETDSESGLVRIEATIMVEKESQKGIIIGKKGEKLKEIGKRAREEIEKLLGKHVYMEIWVKVSQKWRDNELMLKQFGY